jgi:hypothetical protein
MDGLWSAGKDIIDISGTLDFVSKTKFAVG